MSNVNWVRVHTEDKKVSKGSENLDDGNLNLICGKH
jgi:hypothetical protein